MTKEQSDLFFKNTLTLANAVQIVGGRTAILQDQQEFIETLSKNGLEISFKLHPSISQ